MTDAQRQKVLEQVRSDIDRADRYFDGTLAAKIKERYEIYTADKDRYKRLYPELSEACPFVTHDFWSTVEWLLSTAMGAFFGSEDILVLQGEGPEDQGRADLMKKVLRYQLEKQNRGFLLFENWFRDAFVCQLGTIKATWTRETETTEFDEVLPGDRIEALMTDPAVRVTALEETDSPLYLRALWTRERVTKSHAVLENLSPHELRWSPEAKRLSEAHYVAHRRSVSADWLRRRAREGVFNPDLVEKALRGASGRPMDDELAQRFTPGISEAPGTDVDPARREVVLYECYVRIDADDDGLLEDLIVRVVEGELVAEPEVNEWGRAPLFTLTPFRDPHQVWADMGYAKIVGEYQDMWVALLKQSIVAVGLSNDPRMFINETAVHQGDLFDNRRYIRVRGDKSPRDVFAPVPSAGLAPETLALIEKLEAKKEQDTSQTRYNQGLDARSLNKTASGIHAIMSASQVRLEQIIRGMAEGDVRELMQHLVGMVQRHMDQSTVIRLFGERLEVAPDDLAGEYDFDINANAAGAVRQQHVENLMQYLAQIYPAAAQMGCATPDNYFAAAKRLLNEMGFKSVEGELLVDPKVLQGMHQQMQQMQQQVGQLSQVLRAGGQGVAPPSQPVLVPASPAPGGMDMMMGGMPGAGGMDPRGTSGIPQR